MENENITNSDSTTTGGNIDLSNLSSTSTSTYFINSSRELRSFEYVKNDEGNFIEATFEIVSNISYYPSSGKQMVKERYAMVDNQIKLIKTISGVEKAGYYVPPTIEWEE